MSMRLPSADELEQLEDIGKKSNGIFFFSRKTRD